MWNWRKKRINSQNYFGRTRLFAAVSDEDIAKVRRLLACGADPNIPEVNGITPLMEAASAGDIEIIQVLLSHGADPHRLDNFGSSVIDYARSQGETETADFLQSRVDPERMQSMLARRENLLAECRLQVEEIVAGMSEKETIDIWYVWRAGKVVYVAQSESQSRNFIDAHPDDELVLTMKRELVGVVEGVLRNWGNDEDPRPHVSWVCPACGESHHTDVYPEELNPALWYCENGFGEAKFLVRRGELVE